MDSTYPLRLSCLHNPVQGAWPARWKDPLFQLGEREQYKLDNSFTPTYADPCILKHLVVPNSLSYIPTTSVGIALYFSWSKIGCIWLLQRICQSFIYWDWSASSHAQSRQWRRIYRTNYPIMKSWNFGPTDTGTKWSVRKSKQDYRRRCPMSTTRKASSSLSLGWSHILHSLHSESCDHKGSTKHTLSELVW